MGSDRRPSFQFYPRDFLASESVSLMSREDVGAYILLLCHCWAGEDCSLPEDKSALSTLSRGDGSSHDEAIARLWPRFIAHPWLSHRITNERLFEERKKQDEHGK